MNLKNMSNEAHLRREICSHMIQGWRYIPHQAHQEERDLQNRIREEVQPVDDLIVPGDRIEIHHE